MLLTASNIPYQAAGHSRDNCYKDRAVFYLQRSNARVIPSFIEYSKFSYKRVCLDHLGCRKGVSDSGIMW